MEWTEPPNGTKNYALIMHDPDTPIKGGWYHWIVINIPLTKTNLGKGESIAFPAELKQTSFGKSGYGGACPSKGHGKHRYTFTVYALDVAKIVLKQELAPERIEALIKQHILGKVSITTYYERK